MKRIIKLMIVCLTLGLASCNSWLDVEQEDSVMEKDLFESLDGFKMALNGVSAKTSIFADCFYLHFSR